VTDADDVRAAQREAWDRVAPAWTRRGDEMQRFGEPVSEWMLDAADLKPGHRVLELAAGAGETGFLAARRIAPGGTLVSTDASEEMVAGARRRAAELGLDNVEFAQMQLEWIDAPAASFDAVLCRWGLMFPLDPEAALREIRRVLKPGGRLAAATWSTPQENRWMSATQEVLLEQGHVEPPQPGAPNPFRMSDPAALRELAATAGFAEPEVVPIPVHQAYASFDDFFALQAELSAGLSEALGRVDERSRTALREGVAERLAAYIAPDGAVDIPGLALGLAATA
jgi:ubiquinone/menaquinone biosynthesis C-methylase UbiE